MASRKKPTLEELIANLPEAEKQILTSQLSGPKKRSIGTFDHKFSDKRIRIGVMGDMHIGHSKFRPDVLDKAFKFYKQEGVEVIYQAGDILEGMSGRPGHIYELNQIGFNAQINYAQSLLSSAPAPIYAITGNHDQWYLKKGDAGVDVGEELEARLSNFHYLGMNEADVKLKDNVTLKLFHPNDGTAYAQSYKIQKLIESFTESEKPNILVEGHYHKSLYTHIRGVHGFEAGCFQDQSEFMRLKKLPANVGFWLLDIYTGKNGVDRLTSTFVDNNDVLYKG